MKSLDSEHSESTDRLHSINRYGEEKITPDYYVDGAGINHTKTDLSPGIKWSRDPRSEASREHFGKGPKEIRTDERIWEAIGEAMSVHHELDASYIAVTVSQGDVILEGNVTSLKDKKLAEEIAGRVRGVKKIFNNLDFII